MNGDITSEALSLSQCASRVVWTQWLRDVSDANLQMTVYSPQKTYHDELIWLRLLTLTRRGQPVHHDKLLLHCRGGLWWRTWQNTCRSPRRVSVSRNEPIELRMTSSAKQHLLQSINQNFKRPEQKHWKDHWNTVNKTVKHNSVQVSARVWLYEKVGLQSPAPWKISMDGDDVTSKGKVL